MRPFRLPVPHGCRVCKGLRVHYFLTGKAGSVACGVCEFLKVGCVGILCRFKLFDGGHKTKKAFHLWKALWAQKDSNPDFFGTGSPTFPIVNRDTLNQLSYTSCQRETKKGLPKLEGLVGTEGLEPPTCCL